MKKEGEDGQGVKHDQNVLHVCMEFSKNQQKYHLKKRSQTFRVQMPEKQILCLSVGSHPNVAYYIYATISKLENLKKN